MESKIIQLPYGIISEKKNPENKLQFNFPPNFRKDILFDKLPYLAHSKNPTLNNVIKSSVVDNFGLQKYLLAMVYYKIAYNRVDGGFNDAVVIRFDLDLKHPSIMKKSNPIDVVFKDKPKLDITGKTSEKVILNQLSGVPSTKDIELAERLAKLRVEKSINNNNNINNNNFPPFLTPLPPPP